MARKLLFAFFSAVLTVLLSILTACGGGGSTVPIQTIQPPTIDITSPSVVSVKIVNLAAGLNFDANGATNVPVTGVTLVYTMSEPINCVNAPTAMTGQLQGTIACSSPTLTVTPISTLNSGVTYSVTLPAVSDLAGNWSSMYTVSFTTKSNSVGAILSNPNLMRAAIAVSGNHAQYLGDLRIECLIEECTITRIALSLEVVFPASQTGGDLEIGLNDARRQLGFLRFSTGFNSFVITHPITHPLVPNVAKMIKGESAKLFFATTLFEFTATLRITAFEMRDKNGDLIEINVVGDPCTPIDTVLCKIT